MVVFLFSGLRRGGIFTGVTCDNSVNKTFVFPHMPGFKIQSGFWLPIGIKRNYSISNRAKDFSMIKILIIWFPLIWILVLFLHRWKNKCFYFCINDINKRIYLKKVKQTHYNKNGKYSNLALFPKVLIYIIFLGIKCKSNNTSIINDVKNLSNHDFFTYESISITN